MWLSYTEFLAQQLHSTALAVGLLAELWDFKFFQLLCFWCVAGFPVPSTAIQSG
jgi:hypothetical protein